MEGAGAARFKRDVEEKNLTGIVVPEVYLATDEVLVTQWIEGGLVFGFVCAGTCM